MDVHLHVNAFLLLNFVMRTERIGINLLSKFWSAIVRFCFCRAARDLGLARDRATRHGGVARVTCYDDTLMTQYLDINTWFSAHVRVS